MTMLSLLTGFIPTASAQSLWQLWGVPCSDLQPGCGQGPANVLANTLPNLAGFMLQITTALAVFMIVWSGVRLVTSLGDDGKIQSLKYGIFYAVGGLFVSIVSQLMVSFVVTQDWGQNQAGNLPINVIARVVGSMLTVFNGLLVVFIVYYGLRMLRASGDTGYFQSSRTAMTWAIIGAILVNLANALVQGVTSFFGL